MDGVWQIVPHHSVRPLGMGAGVDAAVLVDGRVAVIYYDTLFEDLRLALWGSDGWTDSFIDGSFADVGSANAIGLRNEIDDEGSPALRDAFNAELTWTNNLQDFVDLTFDGWAEVIGVSTAGRLYLPTVNR